jgi:hypothetical protein
MEEIVRTMHWLVERGLALYWGTCRWSAAHLAEAFSVARQFNCVPPACEQMEYSMGCSRKKCETAMNELYHRLGVGVLSWSVSSLDSDPGIQFINRKSIAEYQTSGILGPPEANQSEADRPASAADANGTAAGTSAGAEDNASRTGNLSRTPDLSSVDSAAVDQRKLSGVSMKLSRKSSQIDKKKMSSVERQLLESANLNVERLNEDRLQVIGDRLQVDRLSVDRLSTGSAFSTPDKSPCGSRRRTVDRTLSGTSVVTGGSDRAGSVCGSEPGKIASEADAANADRQTRFEALCARLGCDQAQFSIGNFIQLNFFRINLINIDFYICTAWSLRQEHVNSVLISPKSVEQLYLFINSVKVRFVVQTFTSFNTFRSSVATSRLNSFVFAVHFSTEAERAGRVGTHLEQQTRASQKFVHRLAERGGRRWDVRRRRHDNSRQHRRNDDGDRKCGHGFDHHYACQREQQYGRGQQQRQATGGRRVNRGRITVRIHYSPRLVHLFHAINHFASAIHSLHPSLTFNDSLNDPLK